MSELIKITENNGNQAVSARGLHEFLESKQDFSTWIKSRIEKYELIENADYSLLHNFVEQNGRGGHNRVEYVLTVDAAKELSMVEGNEKGKQARRYFIEAEKKYRSMQLSGGFQIPSSFAEALKLAANQAEQIDRQQKVLAEQVHKVVFADAVTSSAGSMSVGDLAKMITQNGYKIGRDRLFKWMRENGYLCKVGSDHNHPAQRYMESGLFEIKCTAIPQPDREPLLRSTTKVTGKGSVYFVNKFLKDNNLTKAS